jgi:hypothetical protein
MKVGMSVRFQASACAARAASIAFRSAWLSLAGWAPAATAAKIRTRNRNDLLIEILLREVNVCFNLDQAPD